MGNTLGSEDCGEKWLQELGDRRGFSYGNRNAKETKQWEKLGTNSSKLENCGNSSRVGRAAKEDRL